jgi:hypothetical protein
MEHDRISFATYVDMPEVQEEVSEASTLDRTYVVKTWDRGPP